MLTVINILKLKNKIILIPYINSHFLRHRMYGCIMTQITIYSRPIIESLMAKNNILEKKLKNDGKNVV
jgi:hypothetical protein